MTLGNDNGTDGQTDRQTDRVRRNMRPPPREEGRIIKSLSLSLSLFLILYTSISQNFWDSAPRMVVVADTLEILPSTCYHTKFCRCSLDNGTSVIY